MRSESPPPVFTATIGFVLETRRASRVNLRGLPNDAMCNAITDVASSPSQYWRKSFVLTSALFPSATKCEMPTPARWACSSSATPSGPDWLENATLPGMRVTGA